MLERTVGRFREAGVALPTFGELADPTTIPQQVHDALATVDPDAAHPLNLFRVHWYNDPDRRAVVPVPEHVVLPSALTGVEARIVVALGDRFPMIGAHKVLAAYGCLVPEVVTGAFDPTTHRAVWPSTGNYCRGGVAISRIMGCRGVAVLPEGMSRERFEWLERWVADPADIIRTPGVESNVREIYDECKRLAQRPDERDLEPVLRVPEPPRARAGDRPRARARVRDDAGARAGAAAPGVRLGDRVRRHDRGRRPPEGPLRHGDRRGRGARVPDACSATGSASTTSRASATSTCPSSTT